MRVAMVSWEYPPLVVGGLAAHVHGLATAMARAGHEVVVLTRAHPYAPDDSEVEGGADSSGRWCYFRDPEGNVFELKESP